VCVCVRVCQCGVLNKAPAHIITKSVTFHAETCNVPPVRVHCSDNSVCRQPSLPTPQCSHNSVFHNPLFLQLSFPHPSVPTTQSSTTQCSHNSAFPILYVIYWRRHTTINHLLTTRRRHILTSACRPGGTLTGTAISSWNVFLLHQHYTHLAPAAILPAPSLTVWYNLMSDIAARGHYDTLHLQNILPQSSSKRCLPPVRLGSNPNSARVWGKFHLHT